MHLKHSQSGWLPGFVFLCLAAAGQFAWASEMAGNVKTVRYSIVVRNTGSAPLLHPAFWIAAPVEQSATQRVVSLKVNLPYRLEKSENGNQTLYFQLEQLPPYGSKIVTIHAGLEMRSAAGAALPVPSAAYVRAAPGIESDSMRIMRQAQLAGGAATGMARASQLNSWVAAALQRKTYSAAGPGALQALLQREGDCTDFAALFTAMNRAAGVPTRLMAGFVYPGNAVLRSADYHNWAEFFSDGLWYLADPHQKRFDSAYGEYIALRVIDPPDSAADSPAGGGRYGSLTPSLDMTSQ